MLNFAQSGIYKTTSFRPEYKAILARAVSQGVTAPTLPWQIKGNALVDRLIRQGIWAKLDFLHVYYTNGASGFTLINWINPTGSAPITSGTPTFTSLSGWNSDGAVSGPYIDTAFTESTNGVRWQLNNCSFIIDIVGSAQEAAYICGAQTGTNPQTRFRPRNASDLAGMRIDSLNNEMTFSNTDGTGFYQVKRNGTGSNNVQFHKNGSLVGQTTNTGDVSLTTVSHNVLRSNTSGATTSTKTVRLYALGEALVGYEAAFYAAWQDYLN